jgi:hypothetical protein
VEGGSMSWNGQANCNELFTISHGTNCCKSNSFPYAFHQLTTLFISVYPMSNLYLDHLRFPGALDAALTPRCAYYTSEIIKNFIHVDERHLETGHTQYGKCEVNQHIFLPLRCYVNCTYYETTTFLLLPIMVQHILKSVTTKCIVLTCTMPPFTTLIGTN